MESASPLVVQENGAVATLTLNRPATKNALNRELVVALGESLKELEAKPSVRALVLTGAGEAFCSGADLKAGMADLNEVSMDTRIDEFHAVIRAIVHSKKAFVAAVDGAAVGFGADLALACDLRVLSTRAYLQEKFVKIGLMPDGGGTFWLPRMVGVGRALEYLLLGEKIEAPLALELGLANRLVEPGELEVSARGLAEALAAGPPLAIAQIRAAVRESFGGSIDDALGRERTGQLGLLGSADLVEGVMAWAARRTPEFQGK